MYKDRILDKYEQVKSKQVRFEGLNKQELLTMQMGEEILKAAYEPIYTKNYLVEDLKEYINKKGTARLTKELYDKIMKIKDGTIVFVKQEIHRGIIMYEVTTVEDMEDEIIEAVTK